MKEIYKTRLAGIMVLRRSDWTEIHYVTGGSANRQSSLNKVSLKNLLCPFYIKNLLKKKVKIYQKYLCSFILTICSWIGPKHVDTIFLNNTYLSFGLRIKFCIFFHELWIFTHLAEQWLYNCFKTSDICNNNTFSLMFETLLT